MIDTVLFENGERRAFSTENFFDVRQALDEIGLEVGSLAMKMAPYQHFDDVSKKVQIAQIKRVDSGAFEGFWCVVLRHPENSENTRTSKKVFLSSFAALEALEKHIPESLIKVKKKR
jgi:hypothetical protein